MKRFVIYRNIRQKACIYGLSIRSFTLMMFSIILSLLVIIFSFHLSILLSLVGWNSLLYLILIRLSQNPDLLHFRRVFPKMLTNKKNTLLYYENESLNP